MPRKMIILLCAVLLLMISSGWVLGQSWTGFQLDWFTLAGGAGDSRSSDYRVEGTLGQALAHVEATSADFRVTGGFWSPFGGVKAPSLRRLFLPVVCR